MVDEKDRCTRTGTQKVKWGQAQTTKKILQNYGVEGARTLGESHNEAHNIM
jgi:hypothetical protein